MRGYVLVETEVGRTNTVGTVIRNLSSQHARILAVDIVTGPFDTIVQIEGANLDLIGKCITEEIQKVDGVQRTTTCLAINIGSPVPAGSSNGAHSTRSE